MSSTVGEALLERRPVLEVEGAAHLLAPPGHPRPPGPGGHRLVDRLEVVDALRDEERQGRADEQVVDVAAQLPVQPGHLVVVEDRAPVGLQHPGRAGVHDDEPGLAEVAGVAPAVGLGLAVDPLGEVVEDLRSGRARRSPRPPRGPRSAATPRPRPAPRARGCRRAGRPSTTRAHRRCARATRTSAFISRCQLCEVFQSSRMSWSSKIIALGSVDSSQRFSGSVQASQYRWEYSSKSLSSSPGGSSRLRRRGDELAHLLAGLVGVHLVAEEADEVRPVLRRRARAG